MGFVVVETLSAFGTWIRIEFGPDPSESDFSLNVPMFVNGPGVSVSHTGTHTPSFIASVFEGAEVSAEEIEGEVEFTHVVFSAKGMYAEEVSCESAAEPITCFRLHHPVSPFVAVTDSPQVEVAGEVKSPAWCKSDLNTQVRAECGIIKKVGFESHVLRPYRKGGESQSKRRDERRKSSQMVSVVS